MNAVKIEEYTVDDIYALPEGQRAELIDGQWFDLACPKTIHQEIVSVLTRELGVFILTNGGKCKVFPAPFAVHLNADNRNHVEPDISVVCDPEKIDENGCNGAPDLVVEVTSPSTIKRDLGIKLFKYRTEGVREYWIVNPDTHTITIHYFTQDDETEEATQILFDDPIVSKLYPDFSVTLAELLS